MKLIIASLLGFWLYCGSFWGVSPALAAISTSKTLNQVAMKSTVNDCPAMVSDCSRSMGTRPLMSMAREDTEFKNNQVIPTVDQFLRSIPRGYYTIKGVDQLKTLAKGKQALLVDVREAKEYGKGHIKGAINIPLRELTQHIDQIPHDRPVVIYCTTGYRTAMGVMALQMLGYDNVHGFPPSIEGWKAAGEEVVTKN